MECQDFGNTVSERDLCRGKQGLLPLLIARSNRTSVSQPEKAKEQQGVLLSVVRSTGASPPGPVLRMAEINYDLLVSLILLGQQSLDFLASLLQRHVTCLGSCPLPGKGSKKSALLSLDSRN